MGHPSCQQAVQQCRKASCTLAWNLNITTSLHSVTSSSSVESSVSDVTSSSSVEISVHYIFGLSESSRMRSALQGKHGKHGKAKQSGSPISGEQAVQHLLSVNVCEETNVCGTIRHRRFFIEMDVRSQHFCPADYSLRQGAHPAWP